MVLDVTWGRWLILVIRQLVCWLCWLFQLLRSVIFQCLGIPRSGCGTILARVGRMVSIGIDFFDQWWMWLFPGLAIATFVIAVNFIGDGLRDMLDPHIH
jgi:ABC-type microcin C transport system permease subunit YejE